MSFTFSTKKRTAVVAAASLIAGIGVSSVLAGPAQAIPYYERACSFDVQSNTAVNGWLAVTGSRVTVNNGTVGRNVVVNFNADAGVDTLSEIRVGYRVSDPWGPELRQSHGVLADPAQHGRPGHRARVPHDPAVLADQRCRRQERRHQQQVPHRRGIHLLSMWTRSPVLRRRGW